MLHVEIELDTIYIYIYITPKTFILLESKIWSFVVTNSPSCGNSIRYNIYIYIYNLDNSYEQHIGLILIIEFVTYVNKIWNKKIIYIRYD